MFPVIAITTIALFIFIRVMYVFQDKIKFFSTGAEKGFKYPEISLLWKLAKKTEMDEPLALYVSVPALNNAISEFLKNSMDSGLESDRDTQDFLTKLYNYRTKIDIEHENKKGVDSTKYLAKGQKLRIILKGNGVFTSEILNNGHEIIIKVPLQKKIVRVPGAQWVGKKISVYLWRRGDAGYVFDTIVTDAGMYLGQSVLHLAQTSDLLRTQKRKSVRCECQLNAQLYFLQSETVDFSVLEVEEGYKCLLEDISEDGALIRVGGKGRDNVQLKLQFELDGKMIAMFGIVRAVEYNETLNQSRLHFECLHLEQDMKNEILKFVYKILPDEKKEVYDAIAQTEEDAKDDEKIVDDKVEDENYGQTETSEKIKSDEKSADIKNEDETGIKEKKPVFPKNSGANLSDFKMKPISVDALAEADVED